MFRGLSPSKRNGLIIGFIVLAAAIYLWPRIFRLPAVQPTTNSSATQAREQYAALYEAAWRADDGQDNILVSATWLAPTTIAALGQADRTDTETQLWNVVRHLNDQTVAMVLTVASINGPISDEDIQKSLVAELEPGGLLHVTDWQPMVASSNLINAPAGASQQSGVALFSAKEKIDWNSVQVLRLHIKGLGREADRQFTWSQPRLLMQVEN